MVPAAFLGVTFRTYSARLAGEIVARIPDFNSAICFVFEIKRPCSTTDRRTDTAAAKLTSAKFRRARVNEFMFQTVYKGYRFDAAVLHNDFIDNLIDEIFQNIVVKFKGHLHIINIILRRDTLGHQERLRLFDKGQIRQFIAAGIVQEIRKLFFQVGNLLHKFLFLAGEFFLRH